MANGTFPTDYGFTGQRAHPGLGLMYYRARYYHPALGRFVSADTIVPEPANPQSLNRYSYVYNRPLVFHDPDGRIPVLVATMGIGALIGGVALGVTYAITTDEFNWGEFGVAVAAGALGGALIGSGIGAVHGFAVVGGTGVAVATPTGALMAIGAGSGMLASGGGYMIANRATGASFETKDFLITSGVGAIEGGVSAIPGIGAVGRVLVSGVAGAAASAISDKVHGRNVDWEQAAASGGIGLAAGGVGEAARFGVDWFAGRRLASPGISLGPSRSPYDPVDLTPAALQRLNSYQELTRQATKTARLQTARVVARTTARDAAFEAGTTIIERRWR